MLSNVRGRSEFEIGRVPVVGGTSVPEAESTEAAEESNVVFVSDGDVFVGASDCTTCASGSKSGCSEVVVMMALFAIPSPLGLELLAFGGGSEGCNEWWAEDVAKLDDGDDPMGEGVSGSSAAEAWIWRLPG